MQDENFESMHCDETIKITKDKGDVDVITYKAVYKKENGDNWVKIIVTSNEPLKGQQGEVIDFTKTKCQTKIGDFDALKMPETAAAEKEKETSLD